MPNWMVNWHGANLPSTMVAGGSGSTAMSTGVTNALSTKASVGHTHPQSAITNLESTLTAIASSLAGLAAQVSTKAAGSHTHTQADVTDLISTLAALSVSIAGRESSNANIQAHIASAHAPSNAQANADITKAEIEAKLTGELTSHSHAGGPGGGPTLVKTAAGVTIASTFSDITGLSFAVSSASVYYFEFFVTWNVTVSTNGVKFAVTGPASPTRVNYQIDISTGVAGSLVRSARVYDTCVAIAAAGSSLSMPAWIGGTLITGGNGGTLMARAAPRVTTTNVMVSSGCVGVLYGPF